MTALALVAVLLVGQPDQPSTVPHIPDLPPASIPAPPGAAVPVVPRDGTAPAGPASPAAGPAVDVPEPWATLADCESGDWLDGGASFVEGSVRWATGHPDPSLDERSPWSSGRYYGGLQFHLDSWAWAADVGGHDVSDNPAQEPPHVQVDVARTLRDLQGWRAWPVCSRKVGLR